MDEHAPEAPTANRAIRPRTLGLGVVVVAAVLGLAVWRLQPFDPFRPGTTHRATVGLMGCDRPVGLEVDGQSVHWSSHDRLPDGWPNPPLPGPALTRIPGTLEVTDTDRATFTADRGGSVSFVRLRPNQFDDLSCPIR